MDKIIILDMGGQYAHLLARRIRELGVYSEIHPSDVDVKSIKGVKGIILSGGPSSVYEDRSPQPHPDLFTSGIPILGLCYGHHLMAHHLGGKVDQGKVKEYGLATLRNEQAGLFAKVQKREQVWMSHGDEVKELPPGFEIVGHTEDCPIAAMADPKRKLFSFQFHPEVTHTPHGMQMLESFVDVTGADRSYSIASYYESIEEDMKKKVGDKKVFLLVSGGVDSTVCFALLEKVFGKERVLGLFIDNGLVRKDEAKQVKEELDSLGFHDFHVHDASKTFLDALKGIYEPEEKRRIIGETFIAVQQQVFAEKKLNSDEWILAQGTIYPDTIETKGTKHADLIKTHHNRVPLVREMIDKGLVIEPLASLYKDEVRALGQELKLPKHIVWRHPFPGPGLGVRCLCLEKADEPTAEDVKSVVALTEQWKMGMTILPVKSVGVQGDSRTYRHPLVIDTKLDTPNIETFSTKLTNQCKAVNRVMVQLGGEPARALQVKPAYLTKGRLDVLREADTKVMETLHREKLYDTIWQFPVVLMPLGTQGESIILRPVTSKEAMTAQFARVPDTILRRLVPELLAIKGIDAVFYDITNKPPGTIEWE